MAYNFWQSTDGDWTNTASWSAGTVPAAGEDVVFPANNTQDVTTGPASAVQLNSLTFVEGCEVTVMNAGSPAVTGADVVDIRGRGDIYLQRGALETFDRLMIRPSKDDAVVNLTAADADNDGYGPIHVAAGVVTIDTNGGTFANVEVGRRGATGSASVTLASGCGALTRLKIMAGKVSGVCAITTAEVDVGGVFMQRGAAAVTNLYVGGRAFYNSSANPTLIEVYPGGYFDSTGVGHDLTITTLVRWPLSTVRKLSDDVQAVTNDFRFDN